MTAEGQGKKSSRKSSGDKGSSAERAALRHQGRMLALQVLYELDLTNHEAEDAIGRAFAEHEPVEDSVQKQVRQLVSGVLENRETLDPVIAAAAPARSLEEQAAIERNVLRLAAYELLHDPGVPPRVSINEAVELAKRFGGENSGKFTNGVLRTIYERREKERAAAKVDS
ncbi:MAG: transcription antitermination factor NusB [Thermomicrobiales bacterium]